MLFHSIFFLCVREISIRSNVILYINVLRIVPDRNPTVNPCNDPTTVLGNSSLTIPLAHPSYLDELTINQNQVQSISYIHGYLLGYTLGIALINHMYTLHLYTPTICTQRMGALLYSTWYTKCCSFFGNACMLPHRLLYIRIIISEPKLKTPYVHFQNSFQTLIAAAVAAATAASAGVVVCCFNSWRNCYGGGLLVLIVVFIHIGFLVQLTMEQ